MKRLLQERYIPEITKIEHQDGRPVEPPMPVTWYPDDLAWYMTTPKNVIRKFPPFADFQKFLVSETSVGNISRQEVVSMIPPMLMDVRSHHVVLDMCAAPGSKAAQLLEMIGQGEEARVRKVLRQYAQEDGLDLGRETQEERDADLEADPSDHGRSTGLLIANDADYKRGHMLVHQLKRLSSPNLIVTNHDATQFPSIKLPSKDQKVQAYLKFDRILADVPCSGDGTMRKNVNLWKDWTPGNALGLHVTQVRILVRALQLLKPGGKVVYSTCSMNPVENESVVAAAIDRCGGPSKVDIQDCSDQLPNLKRAPGMKQWKIMDKSTRTWSSWEDVQKFAQEENDGVIPGRLQQSMFPPVEGSDGYGIALDRCMRVYPHMQDTGGFFITVLEKKREFKAKNENEPKEAAKSSDSNEEKTEPATEGDAAVEPETKEEPKPAAEEDVKMDDTETNGNKRPLEAEEAQEPPAKKVKTDSEAQTETSTPATGTPAASTPAPQGQQGKQRPRGPIEEPFKYLSPEHEVIKQVKAFYQLSPRFPDDRYMVRNAMGEPAKAIYYTTALMRDILTENEGRGVRFVHGGVKMYMKQDAPSAEVCRWRIQSEGMPIVHGYVGEPRVVHLKNKETFRQLLKEMFPRIAGDDWKRFDEIGERVRDIGMGCCVLRVEPEGDDPEWQEKIALPLWKSIHSLNLMLPKEDRSAMLLRVFNDRSPLINISLKKQQENKDEEAKGEAEAEEQKAEEEVGEKEVEVEAAALKEDAAEEQTPVQEEAAKKLD